MKTFGSISFCLLLSSLGLFAAEPIIDFSKADALQGAQIKGSTAKLVTNDLGPAVQITTGTDFTWPGITLPIRAGVDVSNFKTISVVVRNLDEEPLAIKWRMDSHKKGLPANKENTVSRHVRISLAGGETKTVSAPLLQRFDIAGIKPSDFFGMRGKPFFSPNSLYLENLTGHTFFTVQDGVERNFEIGSITLEKPLAPDEKQKAPTITAEEVYPLIDEFGQFKHADWPGKTHSLEQMQQERDQEAAWLEEVGRPANWNQYGGWKDGPQLEATGWFYTAKHEGKWHFVDPEGKLYFSLGIAGVDFPYGTIQDEREHWYEKVPADVPENEAFWFSWKPDLERSHWYNKDCRAFRFHKYNVARKYGENYEEKFYERLGKRLPAWGINSFGNWTLPDIYLKNRLPYVAYLRPESKVIEGSKGHWGKFCDVFDPDFVNQLHYQMKGYGIARTAEDPYCIGYYVDNELTFGDEISLAVASLTSPSSQKSKQEFIKDLKAKYVSIAALNKAWKSKHNSWAALLVHTGEPDLEAAREDLEAFYIKFVRTYFRTIRDELKKFAPNHLYLGCRYGSHAPINDVVMQANVDYADVVSFNIYTRKLADKLSRMERAGDKPYIIGEFHYGALDRGMFDTGLVAVEDQAERAQAFTDYVLDCVKHPNIVGCHWFQYVNSSTTGRPWDSENYQIGFTDACDTPYAELIEASRKVGEKLYSH